MSQGDANTYGSVIEAIRAAAEKHGDGAYRQLSLAIPLDRWPGVQLWIKAHSREDLTAKVLECLRAEHK